MRELYRIEEWIHVNFINFNMAKCKVLPLGRGSPQYQYELSVEWIESIPTGDSGILVDENLANN